jgi:hypothetical protein
MTEFDGKRQPMLAKMLHIVAIIIAVGIYIVFVQM